MTELAPITPEPLNLKEENIPGATGGLAEDHAPEMDPEHDPEGKARYEGVSLQACSLKDDVLYRKDQLWVPADNQLRLKILQEVHNPPASGHPGITRTEALLQRYYF